MRVAALLCATTLFYACKSDEERLGLAGASNLDIIVIDSLEVFTRTVPEDSFVTYRLSVNVLGAINSDVYGKSNAGIAVNFALPDISGFAFPAGSKVDSIFLVMEYAGTNQYNGNINAAQTIKAYELNETLYRDTAYTSDKNFLAATTASGTYTGPFKVADSVSVSFKGKTERQAPQLRLKLDNATIGAKLIGAQPADFASTTAFQNFLKGLYINADNNAIPANDGGAAFFYLFKGLSGIHMYYNDTSFAKFPISEVSSSANTYTNNFVGTPIASQMNAQGDYNTTYLQSQAGTRVRIDIPGLLNPALENYAIVGAKLIISEDVSGTNTNFAPPTRLLFLYGDTNNNASLVVDAISEPALYGGNYNSNTKQYTFNFPRHVQLLYSELKNKGVDYNKGFYLRIPADNPVTASRLMLDTKKTTPAEPRGIKFRLEVIKVK